jgi:hypothetical protein
MPVNAVTITESIKVEILLIVTNGTIYFKSKTFL